MTSRHRNAMMFEHDETREQLQFLLRVAAIQRQPMHTNVFRVVPKIEIHDCRHAGITSTLDKVGMVVEENDQRRSGLQECSDGSRSAHDGHEYRCRLHQLQLICQWQLMELHRLDAQVLRNAGVTLQMGNVVAKVAASPWVVGRIDREHDGLRSMRLCRFVVQRQNALQPGIAKVPKRRRPSHIVRILEIFDQLAVLLESVVREHPNARDSLMGAHEFSLIVAIEIPLSRK
mmetsp:Transcript_10229/g.29153  ORF Transcript_10229/g.29153 Transcript_10229/m.29153 type:complete len:231 (+) Transcript_10229:64-756(+)